MLVHPSQDDSQSFASNHLTHGHLVLKGFVRAAAYTQKHLSHKKKCFQ